MASATNPEVGIATSRVMGRRLAVSGTTSSSSSPKSKGKGKVNDIYGDGSFDETLEDNIFDETTGTQITTEDGFLMYCRSNLLSYGAASDGLISQIDAAEFVWDICKVFDHQDIPLFQCPKPEFSNLAIEIQLSFVWYICPNDSQASNQRSLGCLADLSLQQTEFGYTMTADDHQAGSDAVLGFCCSLLPYLEATGITPMSTSLCPEDLPQIDIPADGSTSNGQPSRSPISPSLPSPTATSPSPPSGAGTTMPVSSPAVMPVTSPTTGGNGSDGSGNTSQPPSTSSPVQGDNDSGSNGSAATTVPASSPTRSETGNEGIGSVSQPSSPSTLATPSPTMDRPVSMVRGPESSTAQPNSLSAGGTVGIVVGSAAMLLAVALVFARRRRNDDVDTTVVS